MRLWEANRHAFDSKNGLISSSPMEREETAPGLHERVLTDGLARWLADAEVSSRLRARCADVDPADIPDVLATYFAALVRRVLSDLPEEGRAERAVAVVNALITVLGSESRKDAISSADVVDATMRQLLALTAVDPNGIRADEPPPRPQIPLSDSDLLVNGRSDLNMAAVLEREIASADAIHWICAFVLRRGLRILEPALERHLTANKPLRVLTSTYLGVTEVAALEWLHQRGANVRVSLDGRRTRLHAKAWLFERRSGFHTAYVGSSNVSHSALVDGLEWNVRLSRVDAEHVLEKFRAAFDGYFEDPEFEPFDAERFTEAARRQKGTRSDASRILTVLEARPYSYQQEILDRLASEREVHDRHKNLVVAATGTGKTVVAAFDYKRLRAAGHDALLFVAHRREILEQSLATFRAVLRQPTFGELLVGGERPSFGRHVFASIQSLARLDARSIDPTAYAVVIVDEFHHAEAETYRRLLDRLRPSELIGLTATPERADGASVQDTFFGGHIAAELRLWNALEKGLLCPFQYFGIADDVSLADVEWKRGRYDEAALSRIYTGNDVRAKLIARAVSQHVDDPARMRMLGFCVSVAHAEFMARRFNEFGIASVAVTGSTPDRDRHIASLRAGTLQALFTVDVFNEGVDIPEVDTIALLRPTESSTVFVQQLGRGLRLAEGKSVVTVLDFIGQARREFRFDLRFQALVASGSRRAIEEQVANGFTRLPAGCAVQLQPVARQRILDNLRSAVRGGTAHLAQELARLGPATTLAQFAHETQLPLAEIVRKGRSFTTLRRLAGFAVPAAGADEESFVQRIGARLHLDDRLRLDAYARWLAQPEFDPAAVSTLEHRLLLMWQWGMFAGAKDRPTSLREGWRRLRTEPAIVAELREVIEILRDTSAFGVQRATDLPDVPLVLHAHYSRDEVLGAFGLGTEQRPRELREGVLFDKGTRTDLFLFTRRKSEADYSPKTMYQDHAISPELVHWESQHQTRADSDMGRRYCNHAALGSRVLLFFRETKSTADGVAAPYTFLGPADYVKHEGERPMRITWRLRTPMPSAFFEAVRIAAG